MVDRSEKIVVNLPSLADSKELAQELAMCCEPPLTLALSGDLGAGKTQLVRYFCECLGVPAEEITSPTYVLLQRHVGTRTIYHFDFYRLENEAQVWDLGVDELFEQPVLVLIEWADKFPECLPENHLWIELSHESKDHRQATVRASGPSGLGVLARLRQRYPC